MSDFEQSGWSRREVSEEYRDSAEHILQERRTLLRIVASFYRNIVGGTDRRRVLDLGCGDGVMAETLYAEDREIEMVVSDGSEDMIEAAKRRLDGLPVAAFCRITFEDINAGKLQQEPFDFIVSSFAIHHLDPTPRKRLFERILELLKPSAYFLNVDIVLADGLPYTDWYFELWKEWIRDRQTDLGLEESLEQVPEEARAKPENRYDTLQNQLQALNSAGFVDVECHYRYGLFGIYGGRKP